MSSSRGTRTGAHEQPLRDAITRALVDLAMVHQSATDEWGELAAIAQRAAADLIRKAPAPEPADEQLLARMLEDYVGDQGEAFLTQLRADLRDSNTAPANRAWALAAASKRGTHAG